MAFTINMETSTLAYLHLQGYFKPPSILPSDLYQYK